MESNGVLIWPLRMIQLILNMLVNHTSPPVITKNIQSQALVTIPDGIVHNLPCERYIHNCCTHLRILGGSLTSIVAQICVF